MRKTFKVKNWEFHNTGRSITKAQLRMSDMKEIPDADKGEMLLFLLRVDKEKTKEDFEDYLESLSDEEYIKVINTPVQRIQSLGKQMQAYTSKL